MRLTARLSAAFILASAVSLATSAPAGPADPSRDKLTAALVAACPAKHLEWVDEYDLTGVIEAWEGAVTPTEHNRFFVLKMPMQSRCASATGGHRCDNDVDVAAVQAAGLQESFVKYACSSELACTSAGECHGSVYP